MNVSTIENLPHFDSFDMRSELANPFGREFVIRLELIMIVDDFADAFDSLFGRGLQLVITVIDELHGFFSLESRE